MMEGGRLEWIEGSIKERVEEERRRRGWRIQEGTSEWTEGLSGRWKKERRKRRKGRTRGGLRKGGKVERSLKQRKDKRIRGNERSCDRGGKKRLN